MNRLYYLMTFVSLFAARFSLAQDYNPYKSIGKKGKVVTLSKGRYVETFDTDSIQRIGSVLFNIRTKKIVKLLNAKSVYNRFSDNSSASRWYSPDPMAEKFRDWSPYNFALNNPIRYNDKDGNAPNDIVYFNSQGQEIRRVQSNTVFKTYVQYTGTAMSANQRTGPTTVPVTQTFEAPMPGVATGYEDSKYQKNDYQIAASTFILNRELSKETSGLPGLKGDLPVAANHTLGTDMPAQLDVDVVKAMVLVESGAGTVNGVFKTGTTDVMQVNNSGDWGADKSAVGLTNGQTMTPETSINAGVKWLFLKGLSSNASGVSNWRNGQGGNWDDAVQRYNGGGDKNYLQKVQNNVNNMQPAQPGNY